MELHASGTTWAIATPHTVATEAGAVAFERGGNAIDAALAAAVTLAVSYPVSKRMELVSEKGILIHYSVLRS